jgi:hypothetical protein
MLPGGLPIDETSLGIEGKYRCTYCKYLLVSPLSTLCGHHYCSDCFEKLIKYVLYIEFLVFRNSFFLFRDKFGFQCVAYECKSIR